jgi:hypothetical protein
MLGSGGDKRVNYVIELVRGTCDLGRPVVLETVRFASAALDDVVPHARQLLVERGPPLRASHVRVQNDAGELLFTLAM